MILILTAISDYTVAQTTINGKVSYQKDDSPAAFANVELNNKSVSTMTDGTGSFQISIANPRNTDTVVISSIGYENIRIPLSVALKRSEYKLKEIVKSLEPVTVFNTHQTVGTISESVGYFRSWNSDHTGGEIGRIFKIPYDAYKIDKVRFKVGNTCNACLLRLHMREVKDGIPGNEIIDDSITVSVSELSLDDKVPEFDLTPYNFTFHKQEIFVGIEVLDCSKTKNESCSFNFAGTDKGEYLYKSNENSQWITTNNDYTIYLKLFLRY